MSFVIYVRNPATNDIIFVKTYEGDEGDEMATDTIAQFDTEADARATAEGIAVCDAWGYEVVDLP